MAVHKQIMGKIGRTYKPVVSELTVGAVKMESQNIDKWKKAIDAARSELNPERRELIKLYENIAVDGHTSSVMEKRRNNVTNKNLRFVTGTGKSDDTVKENIIQTPWHYDILCHVMDAIAYGHSLMELVPKQGVIATTELINRRNVMPEKGFLRYSEYNNQDGFYYRDDPRYKNHFIEAGGKKDYGKLMTAAQYIIYKRGGFGDWAQLVELFSNPFRVGKYNMWDEEAKKHLKQALATAGSAQYMVIPEGTSLEFPNPMKPGQSDMIKDLLEFCNEEIAKTFLGQTMTTTNGSSLSQSQVHKEVEEEITLSDMIRMEYQLNWQVAPKLRALGLPLPEGKYMYPETADLDLYKRMEIDKELDNKIELPAEYWYETYGIDEPSGGAKLKVQLNPKDDNADKNPDKTADNDKSKTKGEGGKGSVKK